MHVDPGSAVEISVLVITKNEEANIAACLETVSWAKQIVIVDAFSDDATVEVARGYTADIHQRQWDNYSAQRNFGHTKCDSKWILTVDADERVTDELRREIEQAISSDGVAAYRIYRRDWMFGKWVSHGTWPLQCHVRLYQKQCARWEGEVHETAHVEGEVAILHNPLLHLSHLTVAKFVSKMNTYTDIQARVWYGQGVRQTWCAVVLGPARAFLQQYVLYQGFLDGGHGLALAVLMAMYSFLERIKLWELWYKRDHGIAV